MTRDSPPIAAVVVTFNSATTILACVTSLLRSELVGKVVVVDNGSTDDTLQRLSTVGDARLHVIPLDRNTGFSRGVNLATRQTDAPLLAIVNPDAVSHDDTLPVLCEALASGEYWAVGPALLNRAGIRERSARRFPTEKNALFNWRYLQWVPRTRNRDVASFLMLERDLTDSFECDWLSGAFVLVRRDVFDSLGGFDPSYFLYYEEVDLFHRAHDRGHRCRFVGAATADHAIGHSASSVPLQAGAQRIAGFIRYYRRYLRTGVVSDLRFAAYLVAGVFFLEVLGRLRTRP